MSRCRRSNPGNPALRIMRSIVPRVSIAVIVVAAILHSLLSGDLAAERRKPEIHGVFDGDTMYTVLPPDAIPAITSPTFITGAEADSQMYPGEPVLGLVIGDDARAYSLWHLDDHEIANDVVGDSAVAVTW